VPCVEIIGFMVRLFRGMSLVDASANAAISLRHGPVSELKTSAGKIFAGSYAIFSGPINRSPVKSAMRRISDSSRTWRRAGTLARDQPFDCDEGVILDYRDFHP
jgi:hypothetical protein